MLRFDFMIIRKFLLHCVKVRKRCAHESLESNVEGCHPCWLLLDCKCLFFFPCERTRPGFERKWLKVCWKVVWRTEANSSHQHWAPQKTAGLSREAEHNQINFSSTVTRKMNLTAVQPQNFSLRRFRPVSGWRQHFTLFLSVWWLQNVSCGSDHWNQSGCHGGSLFMYATSFDDLSSSECFPCA